MNHFIRLFFISMFFVVMGCAPESKLPPGVPYADEADLHVKGARPGQLPASVDAESETSWFNQDPTLDSIEGVSADRAYAELNLITPDKPIVVAVIDSGVDVEHEDLQGKIWINSDEIAGNGIDDDQNGYVDDLHGWNFLGSLDENGKPVHLGPTTLEVTRELVKMKKLKSEKESRGEKLTEEEAQYLKKLSDEVSKERETAQRVVSIYGQLKTDLKTRHEILKAVVKVEFDQLTLELVEAIESNDSKILKAKQETIDLMNRFRLKDIARLNRILEYYGDNLRYYFNESFDPRAEIIGDDLSDFSDRAYGNPDVKAVDADHGTHVAGIIAAVRKNGLGMDGVAEHVKIMSLRAVPNGDEYDKDVANAVRYAVDNGADIINMSFGKSYSPHKAQVDEAFLYAAEKGVLIVHAAGNDSQDNDLASNFPNRKLASGGQVTGWIEVGASASLKNQELPAGFTNYGDHSVDLFAPGVAIRSTVPDQNQYAVFSGTSMASPTTAGVAALVQGQHPNLRGEDLKQVLTASVRLYPQHSVRLPSDSSTPTFVLFETLSITGGIVDAFAALKRAAQGVLN